MRPYRRGLTAEEVLQKMATIRLRVRLDCVPSLTWEHVPVLVDQLRVAGDEGEEDTDVGRPGDDPDGQQGEASSPQSPLHLELLEDEAVGGLHGLAGLPGLELVVSVQAEYGEVGEEDEEVGQDVAQDQEGPGVQTVRGGSGGVVHGAGVEVALVHVPVYTEVLYTGLLYIVTLQCCTLLHFTHIRVH